MFGWQVLERQRTPRGSGTTGGSLSLKHLPPESHMFVTAPQDSRACAVGPVKL